jgi:hypothetical protein
LSIGDDLRGIEGLFEVCNEGFLVAVELGGGATENLGGTTTLSLDGTEAASKDGFSDESDGHAEVESIDCSPLAGTLLASRVKDLLDKSSAIVVVEAEDITSDLDQEGVENTLVPFRKDVAHLSSTHAKTTLHDIVRLARSVCLKPQKGYDLLR